FPWTVFLQPMSCRKGSERCFAAVRGLRPWQVFANAGHSSLFELRSWQCTRTLESDGLFELPSWFLRWLFCCDLLTMRVGNILIAKRLSILCALPIWLGRCEPGFVCVLGLQSWQSFTRRYTALYWLPAFHVCCSRWAAQLREMHCW